LANHFLLNETAHDPVANLQQLYRQLSLIKSRYVDKAAADRAKEAACDQASIQVEPDRAVRAQEAQAGRVSKKVASDRVTEISGNQIPIQVAPDRAGSTKKAQAGRASKQVAPNLVKVPKKAVVDRASGQEHVVTHRAEVPKEAVAERAPKQEHVLTQRAKVPKEAVADQASDESVPHRAKEAGGDRAGKQVAPDRAGSIVKKAPAVPAFQQFASDPVQVSKKAVVDRSSKKEHVVNDRSKIPKEAVADLASNESVPHRAKEAGGDRAGKQVAPDRAGSIVKKAPTGLAFQQFASDSVKVSKKAVVDRSSKKEHVVNDRSKIPKETVAERATKEEHFSTHRAKVSKEAVADQASDESVPHRAKEAGGDRAGKQVAPVRAGSIVKKAPAVSAFQQFPSDRAKETAGSSIKEAVSKQVSPDRAKKTDGDRA